MIAALVWLLAAIASMHVAEYLIHRFVMHRRTLFRSAWQVHAVEHHGRGRLDVNVDLPVTQHLFFASPLLLLLAVTGAWLGLGAFLLVFWLHAYLWTRLHRAIHGLEDNWVGRSRWFAYWRDHHLAHHRRPDRNFGAVFPWTDHAFGTKV